MMARAEVKIAAHKLIVELGELEAYTMVLNRMAAELEKWSNDIDLEAVEKDRMIAAEIAHWIARAELFEHGWQYREEDLLRRWRPGEPRS